MHVQRRFVKWVDDDQGARWVEVEEDRWAIEVSPRVLKALTAREPKLKERLLHNPDSRESIAAAQEEIWGGPGNPWEGPRLGFDLFLGQSPTWSGAESLWLWDEALGEWVCRFCQHLKQLSAGTYCLGCDRSGKAKLIGHPTEADLAKRPVERGTKYDPPDDGLKGGRS